MRVNIRIPPRVTQSSARVELRRERLPSTSIVFTVHLYPLDTFLETTSRLTFAWKFRRDDTSCYVIEVRHFPLLRAVNLQSIEAVHASTYLDRLLIDVQLNERQAFIGFADFSPSRENSADSLVIAVQLL